jgi:hypothetical protein
MSLMKFLTAGKSFDQKNSLGRYQIAGKNPLPKFGSAKNPFAMKKTTTAATPKFAEPETSVAPKTSAADLTKTRKLPVLPEQLKQTKRLPVAAAVGASGSIPARQKNPSKIAATVLGAAVATWRKLIRGASAVFAKMNPFAWFTREKTPAKSAIPRFDKSGMQAELSLDNVKVIRNDLNDADVEVIPAKISVSTNFKPALLPEKRKADGEKAETQMQMVVSTSGPT